LESTQLSIPWRTSLPKAAAAFRFPATSLAERAAVECLNEGQRETMGEAKGVVLAEEPRAVSVTGLKKSAGRHESSPC